MRTLDRIGNVNIRRSYTIAFKRSAIKHFENTNSKRKTANNLQICRTGLIQWIQNKELIFDKSQKGNSRKILQNQTKKKPDFAENETRLFDWFKSKRDNQITVTCFDIQQKMLDLMKEFPPEIDLDKEFKASYGWVRKFLGRNNLVIRRISGSGRGIPSECQNIVQEYIRHVNTVINENSLKSNQIFNFDESSFYMCSPGNYTVDYRGAKKSYGKTSGKEKVRLSCLMCSSADGKKLPILCVVPRKKRIDDLEINDNMIIIYDTDGTFNSQNLKEHYVERILKPHLLKYQIVSSLIILDQARCHTTLEFKKSLDDCGCKLVFIPPTLTNILQPADVCWFKLLKQKYKFYWNDWFINGEKKFTLNGNIAGPGYVQMTKWITFSWLELNPEYISESFKYCGIGEDDPNNFHSVLKNIYIDGLIPENKYVDQRNEDDDFNDVFDAYNSDVEDENVDSDDEKENESSLSEYSEEEEDDYGDPVSEILNELYENDEEDDDDDDNYNRNSSLNSYDNDKENRKMSKKKVVTGYTRKINEYSLTKDKYESKESNMNLNKMPIQRNAEPSSTPVSSSKITFKSTSQKNTPAQKNSQSSSTSISSLKIPAKRTSLKNTPAQKNSQSSSTSISSSKIPAKRTSLKNTPEQKNSQSSSTPISSSRILHQKNTLAQKQQILSSPPKSSSKRQSVSTSKKSPAPKRFAKFSENLYSSAVNGISLETKFCFDCNFSFRESKYKDAWVSCENCDNWICDK